MKEHEMEIAEQEESDETKQAEGPNPEGGVERAERVLHCIVPAEIHLHARRMALESRMSFRDYVSAVLQDAGAIHGREKQASGK